MKRVMLALLVIVTWVVMCGLIYLYSWLHTPIDRQTGTELTNIHIELVAGDSLSSFAGKLSRQSLLVHPKVLVAYGRLVKQTNVKLGEYNLPLSDSPIQILERLIKGDVVGYSVTFVEGITFSDALNLLNNHDKIDRTIAHYSPKSIAERLKISGVNPEGLLFPSTYRFSKGDSDWSVIKRAHTLMKDVLSSEWEQREDNLPYKNAYEALIMASIIERETGAPSEREEIAGVFVRRLQQGMRLQTDPTVIYGMGDKYKGKIRRADLRQATPYNTYTIKGLPPTPIALPGRMAIRAALHPAKGKALFFVARGDGTHQFSATLAEHEAAVKRYQINRKSDYRSSVQ